MALHALEFDFAHLHNLSWTSALMLCVLLVLVAACCADALCPPNRVSVSAIEYTRLHSENERLRVQLDRALSAPLLTRAKKEERKARVEAKRHRQLVGALARMRNRAQNGGNLCGFLTQYREIREEYKRRSVAELKEEMRGVAGQLLDMGIVLCDTPDTDSVSDSRSE